MSAGTPWSVKGIDAKARSVAKELARRSGMTLGEWLNQMILEGRDVSAALAAEIENEAEQAPQPAPTLRSVRESVRHQIEDDDFAELVPAREVSREGLQPSAVAARAPEPRLSGARQAYAEMRREALPQEAPRGDIEHVAQALETLGSRLETSETRSAQAVRGVSQAVEALLGRLERSEERVAEQERVISDQVEEVLTSVERLSRTEEDTAIAISERLSQTERRIDQQGERLEGIAGYMRDGRQRLDALEAEVRDAGASRLGADETLKALEGALGGLANTFYEDRMRASASVADVRQDMVGLSQRLAQIELRDPQKEAQALIDQVVARMAQRLESAEARTSSSIRALEQAFSHLDARLIKAERGNADAPQAAQTLTQLAGDLSRRMDEARAEMLSAVESATQARAESQTGFEGHLNAIAAQVASVEKRSARALEQMGHDVLRIADTLNRRVQGVEKSTEASVARLSGEVAEIAQKTEARLDAATSTHGQALERLGGEIARISERLNAKIGEAERRAAEAVSGLRDKVNEGQATASNDIAERIRASESRTQAMLEEARRKIDARLGQASLQSLQVQAVAEVAKAVPAAADVRGSADLPNPFSAFIDALKPAEAALAPAVDPRSGARAIAESVRPERATERLTERLSQPAESPVFDSLPPVFTAPQSEPVAPVSREVEGVGLKADAAVLERPVRREERMDITGHLLSGLGGDAPFETPKPVAASPAAPPVVTDAFGETPADPFAPMHDLDDDIAFDAERDAASRPDPYARKADPFADDDLLEDEGEVSQDDDFIDATQDDLPAEDDEFDADFEDDPFADIDLSRKTAPRAGTRPDIAPQALSEPRHNETRHAAPSPEAFEDIFDRDLDLPTAPPGAPGLIASEADRPHTEPGARLSTRDALMSARAAVQASMDGAEEQRGLRFGVGKRPPEGVAGLDSSKPQGGLLGRLIKTSAVSVAIVAVGVTGYYTLVPSQSSDGASRLNSAQSGPVAGGSEEGTTFAANLTELPTNGTMSPQDRIADLYGRAETALKARDPAALGMLESVANLGHAEAQFRLGYIYDGKEPGFEPDKKLARKWYGKASDNGSVKAMFYMAMMLYNGEGGRVDFTQSAELFRKAADRGLGDAQYNLASLYLQGKGIEQSNVEAYKWFSIAANGNVEGAEQQVRAMSAQLSESQRALAESEAARFKPMSESPVIVAHN